MLLSLPQGNVGGACETLQEIQVETVGSMEAPEKIDFLLEQMRLCLDHHDYVRAELTAEKVSKKLLNHVDNQERKLRYHRLMIRFYQKKSDYLSCCKSYRAIFDTPLVQADAAQVCTGQERGAQFIGTKQSPSMVTW